MSFARVPFLDPELEYVGTTKLRYMTIESLEQLKRPIVIQALRDGKDLQPLAVIIPYQQYLVMQKILEDAYLQALSGVSNIGQTLAERALEGVAVPGAASHPGGPAPGGSLR